MRPQSELPRISKRSRPYSNSKATRAAQIAKETSVSEGCLRVNLCVFHGLQEADGIVPFRSKMGELESRSLRVHPV